MFASSQFVDVLVGFAILVLLLSMIVQSVQSVMKKLLKMRSRQVEESLRRLFQYTLAEPGATGGAIMPLLRFMPGFRIDPAQTSEKMIQLIRTELIKQGRVSSFGNPLLDKLTRDELLNLARLAAKGIEQTEEALKSHLERLGQWFDTIMAGVNERYSRGMRWMAIGMSLVLVIIFNANTFDIYRRLLSDQVYREMLNRYAVTLEKPAGQVTGGGAGTGETPSAEPAGTPEDPAPDDPAGQAAALSKEMEILRQRLAQPSLLGLRLIDRKVFQENHPLEVILGWLIMTALVGMGAPFWEDILESVLGLKNFLRRGPSGDLAG